MGLRTWGRGLPRRADYNRDGKLDLATNNRLGIAVLLGTGKAASPFAAAPAISATNTGCLIAGDLNDDGIPDLLAPANGAAVAYLGNGDGTFIQKGSTATPTSGYLALADFNHDGKIDFATSANLLALGNGDGTFQTPAPFIPAPPYNGYGLENIAAGDLNGDGWPDAVVSDFVHSRLFVLINNHHGGFAETLVKNSELAAANEIVLRDINGVSLDIVVACGPGAVVLLGDGKGGFVYKETLMYIGTAGGPPIIMVADVNGDHIPDVGVMAVGSLSIFTGKGDGTFQPGFTIGGGPSPSDMRAMNLHGQSPLSGLADIVSADSSGGVMVLLNTTR